MKRLVTSGLFAVLLVGLMGGVGQAEVNHFLSSGTHTIKLDLNVASGGVTSDDHAYDGAVKTPWVTVPTGIPFTIFVESQDLDSTTAFGPDTIHIGLETTVEGSLAHVTPSLSGVGKRVMLLWTNGSEQFSLWGGSAAGVHTVASRLGPAAHYFQNAPGDTSFQTPDAAAAALDTIDAAATSLKTFAFADMSGGAARVQNMGMLRFSLCMGDDDSTADAAINMDCYIIFREDMPGKIHGAIDPPDVIHGGTFRDPAEYADFREDVFYGGHWVQERPFDGGKLPVRSLR